jgi:hypothetical protein
MLEHSGPDAHARGGHNSVSRRAAHATPQVPENTASAAREARRREALAILPRSRAGA